MMDENCDQDEHQEREKKEISATRKRQKLQRVQNHNLQVKGNRMKESIQMKENQQGRCQ